MTSLKEALNKLGKWRTVFAGWQLGTRLMSDPESQAVRDHREATMILRVEASALARLLIDKGLISLEEFEAAMIVEAQELDAALERRFPGFRSSADGMVMDARAAETVKGWRP